MQVRLEVISQAGNNVLVNMFFDNILINPSGPLQMAPIEYNEFCVMLLGVADANRVR